MEQKVLGDISFKRVFGTTALRRFIEERIQGWIRKQSLEPYAKQMTYHVILEKEGDAVETRCQVFIYSKRYLWEASEFGRDPKKALEQALSNLRRQGRRLEIFTPILAFAN